MTDESVRLVRSAYEAWNARGVQALEARVTEDVELHDAPQMPDAATWRGGGAVLARLESVAAAVGGGSVEITALRAAGDEVLVAMRWTLAGENGDTDLGSVVHLVQVRDGRISRLRVFLDEAQATAAARRGEAGG